MKRLWNFLGDLALTFWLLLGVTVLFLIGMYYSIHYYSLVQALDTMPVQVWLQQHLGADFSKTWWVALLLMLLMLLGINTFICACNRIVALWPRRRTMPGKMWFTALCPSLIHALFILLLVGHFLTITVSDHQKIPISPGAVVDIPRVGEVTVTGITVEKYPAESHLKELTRQVHVTLELPHDTEKKPVSVKFLEPLLLNGTHLHLDLERKPKQEQNISTGTTVCNRSEFSLARHEPQVFLLVTRDPGFNVIVAGFCGIIVLLLWYYVTHQQYGAFMGNSGAKGGDRIV